MKSIARNLIAKSRRNNRPGKQLRSPPAARRRPLFEPLEQRQMMAIVHEEGTPFWTWQGNYTPPQHAQMATTAFLSQATSGDALTIAKNYLIQNSVSFGLTTTDVSRAIVTNQYVDSLTGETHIYFQQTFNGLPVADSHANVSVMPDGRISAANANFVTGLAYPANNTTPTPTISAHEALDVFAAAAMLPTDTVSNVVTTLDGPNRQTTINDPKLSVDPIIARLQYVPAPAGGVDLGWQIIARPPNMAHWFDVAVGASGERSAEVTRVADWVANASYNVFARPIQDPLYGPRSIQVDPHDSLASPFGWHDINFLPGVDTSDTSGNNVIAQLPAPNARTAVSPTLDFNFVFDPTMGPVPNTDAQLTNLFYWANLAHDISYHYGFNEAAGNFQFANRSGVGLSNDPVIALDQATLFGLPVIDNAFFATPPDGISPTLFSGVGTAAPGRSASFSGDVVLHEYMHGISNRLTGGPANANALQNLQSGGMGEGWSDWFAMISTMRPGDTQNTPRFIGQWLFGQSQLGPGIRRFPYSVDMTVNPLTLANFNGDLFPGQFNSEVHNAGEIWASALWDITWRMINRYGLSNDIYNGNGGNNLAMELIFQGLKRQPANPTFLQARDAIISADLALNGGANYDLLWSAFARRGFGLNASTINSNSQIVSTAFNTPPPLGQVQGKVFNDLDGDGRRESGEPVLPGITVYHDANQNARLDANERRTVTRDDGTYTIVFVTSQMAHIRQALPTEFKQTLPANNAARVVYVNAGQVTGGVDFGTQPKPGKISGYKFNDLDGDGAWDVGEPPIPRVVVYVDMNNDGTVSILEPSAMTDNFGRYVILNVPPGSDWIVREVFTPGVQQTMPGPFSDIPFAYSGVDVFPNQTTFNINFANTYTTAEDYGDAPVSYRTTRAANGPRHGILPGFHLGVSVDAEPDGQPTPDATGDDTNPPANPDDENGIVFLSGGISPGTTSIIQVTVSTGPASPGRLHGWVDFDQDGVFESNERVVANMLLYAGTRNISFQVPNTALNGTTFARFRYGFESDLLPTGPSVAGEVEDYQINVLPSVPVANPDVFPRPGDPLIKANSVDYVLDVLANDTSTVFGPPRIVVGSFPDILPGTGSRLELNAAGNRILYTAGPNVTTTTQETFTYQVTDGRTVSAPGTVVINISPPAPIALDNTYTFPASDTLGVQEQLRVMDNDLFPPDTVISGDPVLVLSSSADPGTTLTVAGGNQRVLNFTAPPGFRGTVIYRYQIDDNDPTTDPGTALVTIQVVDPAATPDQLRAAGYLAELSVVLLDPITGLPTTSIIVNQGETFEVEVTARDLRTGGTGANRGVKAAYLDLLFDRLNVTPVSITFNDPPYGDAQRGEFNEPAPGQIDEAGAADLRQVPPVGQGEVTVFTVVLRATGSTGVGGPIQIIGDPADVPEETDVLLSPDDPSDPTAGFPVLTDVEVFLRQSGNVTILGAGEGEFVNRLNPLDVNADRMISAADALAVINSLNATGMRSLVNQSFVASTAPQALIDVNMDSMLTAADALTVINYLNARGVTNLMRAEGEGEGEAANSTDASWMALVALDSGTASTQTTNQSSPPPVHDEQQLAAEPVAPVASAPLASTDETAPSTAKVDATAADDLFAELAQSRAELKRRYFNR